MNRIPSTLAHIPRQDRAAMRTVLLTTLAASAAALVACGSGTTEPAADPAAADGVAMASHAQREEQDRRAAMLAQGKSIFRFDTFGDESKWTDALRMHEVIRSAVDPTTALSVGLKVDAEALPAAVVAGIRTAAST